MAVPAQMQQYQYQQEQATRRPETDKINQVQMIMNRYGSPKNPLSPGGKQSAIPTYAQNTGTVAPMGGRYTPPQAISSPLQQGSQEFATGLHPVTGAKGVSGFGSTWSPYDPMKERSYRTQQAVNETTGEKIAGGPSGGRRLNWWEKMYQDSDMTWLDKLRNDGDAWSYYIARYV